MSLTRIHVFGMSQASGLTCRQTEPQLIVESLAARSWIELAQRMQTAFPVRGNQIDDRDTSPSDEIEECQRIPAFVVRSDDEHCTARKPEEPPPDGRRVAHRRCMKIERRCDRSTAPHERLDVMRQFPADDRSL